LLTKLLEWRRVRLSIFLESILIALLGGVLVSSIGYYAEKFGITTLSFCIAHAALA